MMTAIDAVARRPRRLPLPGFGAARATLTTAPNAEANIISLNFNPPTLPFASTAPFGLLIQLTGGAPLAFVQRNDPCGKTLYANTGIVGFWPANLGCCVTTGWPLIGTYTLFANSNGTRFFCFLTTANQHGWLAMDLGSTGGDIHYLAAALNNTPGAPIHVGTTGVPEPSPA